MPLIPFPPEFPAEALPVLARFLRKQASAHESGNAAWNMAGWLGGSFLPGQPEAMRSLTKTACPDEEAAQKLEEAYAQITSTPKDAQAALFGDGAFMRLITPILKEIAKRIMEELLKG